MAGIDQSEFLARVGVEGVLFQMLHVLRSGFSWFDLSRRHLRVVAEQAEVLHAFRNDKLLALAIEAHFRVAQMGDALGRAEGKFGFWK